MQMVILGGQVCGCLMFEAEAITDINPGRRTPYLTDRRPLASRAANINAILPLLTKFSYQIGSCLIFRAQRMRRYRWISVTIWRVSIPCFIAKRAHDVIAFEPFASCAAVIEESARLNGFANVDARRKAIADQVGFGGMRVAGEGQENGRRCRETATFLFRRSMRKTSRRTP